MVSNVKANGAYAVNKAIRQVIQKEFGDVAVNGRKYSESNGFSPGDPNKNWRYKWYRIKQNDLQKMAKIKMYVDTAAPIIEATTGIKVRCEWSYGYMCTSMLLVTKDIKSSPIRKRKK